MAVKYSLNECAQLQAHSFFVDANVLIYLFWPTGSVSWAQKYAKVYRSLLRQGNQLYIDFLVLSEVINRTLRIEHQKINSKQKFKEFRDSKEGQEALRDIYVIVENEILNRFNFIGKAFSKQDMKHFLKIDELDFVDKATVALCKENALVLLTNDRDFRNADVDILTANPAILKVRN